MKQIFVDTGKREGLLKVVERAVIGFESFAQAQECGLPIVTFRFESNCWYRDSDPTTEPMRTTFKGQEIESMSWSHNGITYAIGCIL